AGYEGFRKRPIQNIELDKRQTPPNARSFGMPNGGVACRVTLSVHIRLACIRAESGGSRALRHRRPASDPNHTGAAHPVKFPRLFTPLSLGSLTLPNRIVMGAMHTAIDHLDRPYERIRAFYRARVEGEVGM